MSVASLPMIKDSKPSPFTPLCAAALLGLLISSARLNAQTRWPTFSDTYDLTDLAPPAASVDWQSPPDTTPLPFVQFIRKAVTPSVWSHGGAMHLDGQKLTVTAPPATHSALQNLLDKMRLRIDLKISIFRCPFSAFDPPLAPPTSEISLVDLDPAQLLTLRNLSPDSFSPRTLPSDHLTVFNYQCASIIHRTRQSYVRGLRLMPTPNKQSLEFKPIIDSLDTDSLWFAVVPIVSPDAQSVRLSLKVQTTQMLSFSTIQQHARTPNGSGLIGSYQIPDLQTQRMRTTVSVRLGHPIILAGSCTAPTGNQVAPLCDVYVLTPTLISSSRPSSLPIH